MALPGLGLLLLRPEGREERMSEIAKKRDVVRPEELATSEEKLWQDAVAFSSDKKRNHIVQKIARKYMIFSPYSLEEYVAEAKVVAFEAMKLSLAKGESDKMEGYFWTLLKGAFSRMSTNPSQADVVPGEDAGPLACAFAEYTEEWDEENGTRPTCVSQNVTALDKAIKRESLAGILLRKRLDEVLKSMTDRERQVWALVLDGRSSQEIAKMLKTSRQNVEKLRERGIGKIKKNSS